MVEALFEEMTFGQIWLGNPWTGTQGFPWWGIAIIAAMISVSFPAIAFMLSKAFESKDLEKWAKGEFAYVFSTIILVGFIVVFIGVLVNKSAEFSGYLAETFGSQNTYLKSIFEGTSPGVNLFLDPEEKQFIIPYFYLDSMIVCAKVAYGKILSINFLIELISSITTGGALNILNISKNLLTGPFVALLHNLGYLLTYILYTLELQNALLMFIQQTMLTVFLPIGIISRSFSPTRGFGNFLIALSIGLYFIYPLVYGILLVISQPLNNMETRCGITGYSEIAFADREVFVEKLLDEVGAEFGVGIFDNIFGFTWSAVKFVFSSVSKNIESIKNTVDVFLSLFSEIAVYGVFYPFVILTVVLTFIKSFSVFLGVEAQEFAQGLIRLI